MERGSDWTREVNRRDKSLKLLVTTIPALDRVIHLFTNVYKHFRLEPHDRKMHLKLLSAAMFGVALSQSSLGWQMPFNSPHRLLRPYLQPNSDYSAGHRGIDLEAAIGETVYAPADGQVKFIGKIVNRGVVTLMHAGDLVSELEPVCSTLKTGAQVSRGEAIGQICQPDASYRPHVSDVTSLHFSVRVSGRYLSPQKFVGGLNPSRLLPYALG